MTMYDDIACLAAEIGRSPDWVLAASFWLAIIMGIVFGVAVCLVFEWIRKKP